MYNISIFYVYDTYYIYIYIYTMIIQLIIYILTNIYIYTYTCHIKIYIMYIRTIVNHDILMYHGSLYHDVYIYI